MLTQNQQSNQIKSELIETDSTLFINCDMGEWDAPHLTNRDHEIMPYIDLCNIACGGHAGSRNIIRHTIELAKSEEVQVGAHPGYVDRVSFGRKYHQMTESALAEMLTNQIDLFLSVCEDMEVVPYHIKPHGALYHTCNHQEMEMLVLIDVIKMKYSHLTLLVFPDSNLHKSAITEGLTTMTESFIDRKYTEDLKLASREVQGSVITSVQEAETQFMSLRNGNVKTIDHKTREMKSETTCIHGDNPNVIDILKAINENG